MNADGSITIAGGLHAGNQTTDEFYTVDPSNGQVGRRGRLPVPVHDTAGVSMPGGDWILGGGNSSEQRVVQQVTCRRATVLGQLPGARSDLAATASAGRACVLGGYDGSTVAVGEIVCSSDGRHWRRLAALPVAVRYPAVVQTGDKVLVFGGQRGLQMVDAVQEVDIRTGTARLIGHLPVPLGHEAAVSTPSGIWLLGGRTDSNTVTARSWSYDLATGKFRRIRSLPYPLADAGVAVTPAAVTPTAVTPTAVTPTAVTPTATWLLGGETPNWTNRVLEIGAR